MTRFVWRRPSKNARQERRVGGERRSGYDRRAPVKPLDPIRQTLMPTDRQMQILALAASGDDNRAIGKALGISDQTVKNHLSSIFGRVGASNTKHAIAICIVKGWLVPANE